jgi:tRNA (guanine-N(7)-)-methyltransferase
VTANDRAAVPGGFGAAVPGGFGAAVPGGFGPTGTVSACEVEIGCGNGHFLCEYARENPDTLLIGIDIKEKRCIKAREKMEKRGLRNVSIVQGNAEAFLRDLPPASVDAFHIYFPDPWPKSRHRKRRFFTMENLQQMHDRLRVGGRVYFGTDFFDYYIQAKVLIALHHGFQLREDPMPEAVLNSLYGQKASGAKKSIHLFSAARSADEQREEHEHQREIHGDIQ